MTPWRSSTVRSTWGSTFFDTADVYGPFTNEEAVGSALRGRRDEVTLATKVGLLVGPNGGYPLTSDARPERIAVEIDESLRRLGTDHIDLYYLHRVDPNVPLEDSWGALAALVRSGKVGAIGLCEVGVDQLDRVQAIHPVAAVQSELSLWTRDALAEVVPWCVANGAAFVPFSPLGRGFLTGTITDVDVRCRRLPISQPPVHGRGRRQPTKRSCRPCGRWPKDSARRLRKWRSRGRSRREIT